MYLINLNLLPEKELPENTIYIGRTHLGFGLSASIFANPFYLKNRNDDNERKVVLEQYRDYLWTQIQEKKILISDLKALEGHNLACFCAPKLCHGMIVKEAVVWARNKTDDMDFTEISSNPFPMPKVKTISDMLKMGRR